MADANTNEGNLIQKLGGSFGKILILVALLGVIAGGLLVINHFLNGQPPCSSHATPAEIVVVKVFDHKVLKEIGIPEIKDGQVTGPLMSIEEPAVDITALGDWKDAKWIKVDNDRKVLGFMVSRPVVGKGGKVEKYYPPYFWALKRG